jgi:ArsR family transcriptional regulator, arsenate/arsenite/antimonite-responsive transcriptional repressor
MKDMGAGEARTLDDRGLIRVLKALADPTRFRMVQEIAAAGELSCGQVAELFDVSQPTVSHHLNVLVEAGVLSVRVDGQHRYTSVNHPLVSGVTRLLAARLGPRRERAARARA